MEAVGCWRKAPLLLRRRLWPRAKPRVGVFQVGVAWLPSIMFSLRSRAVEPAAAASATLGPEQWSRGRLFGKGLQDAAASKSW
jgi:hypothetical protein